MAVSVAPGASFVPGPAKSLFKTRTIRVFPNEQTYTVSRDGRRFLINTIVEESASVPTKIILNWPAALSRQR